MPILSLSHWFRACLAQLSITNFGFFIVTGLLSVYLHQIRGFDALSISLIVFCYSAGLRFARLALSPVLNAYSPRRLMVTANAMMALGYLGLALSNHPLVIAALLLVAGSGYGMNGVLVTTLASIEQEAHAKNIRPVFAYMHMLSNLAAAIAPLLATQLSDRYGITLAFVLAGGCCAVASLRCLWLPDTIPAIHAPDHPFIEARRLLRQRSFVLVLGTIAGGWFLYTQKFALLSLHVNAISGLPALGTMLLVYALINLFAAVPVARLGARFGLKTLAMVRLGSLLYAVAFALMATGPSMQWIWPLIVLCAIAEAMLMPALNQLVALSAPAASRLVAYGCAALGIGLGEFAGTYGGIVAFRHLGSTHAFALFALLAVLAALIHLRTPRMIHAHHTA